MGCASSSGESSKNASIEKDIGKEKKVNKNTVKLLLIGAGDSGKTTLRKQMRNIYGSGFDVASRQGTRDVIFENLISGARQIMGYVIKDEFENDNEREARIKDSFGDVGVRVYKESKKSDIKDLTEENVNDLKWLWNECKPYKDSYAHRAEYHLQDCWTNFMESLSSSYPTWGGKDWIPSIDDCVRARVRTSGITEESFEIENVIFKLFDCGGQRAERKKWIHFFDNVTAVIFVASLSEYDLYLFEEHTASRLKESLELFSDMCNSKYFKEVPMILFLNKRDLFEAKYIGEKIPLNKTGQFPDAPSSFDVNVAIEWFTNLYVSKCMNKNKQIYVHVTTAVDPLNVKAVFDTCKNIILQRNLASIGFMS